jgi:DUF438 domain-containing protein
MKIPAMIVSELTLYNTLKEKLGDQAAQTVVEGVKSAVKEAFENKRDTLATKEDLARLETKIAETKAEIIKWMFIFWIGQLASFIAIAKLFFHQ